MEGNENPRPKFYRDQIRIMKPQLLAMNLISERPDPSGTPAQCRDRFMKAMYPNSSNPFTSAAQTAQVQHAKSAEAPQLPSA